ncbi:MAG: hypothetical protein QOH39_98 [Verrucomicrobiota bacterium]
MSAHIEFVREFLGSAGSLPAVPGSLPGTILVGKLPTSAGWQPAVPDRKSVVEHLLA